MRALLVLFVLLFAGSVTLLAPISGVLAWVWVAIMNPQREVFGLLGGLRINYYIAVFVILAWLISSERKFPRQNVVYYSLLVFSLWSFITTYSAIDYEHSFLYFDRYFRIFLMITVIAAIAVTRARIHALIWTLFISLGYWGAKGGGFTLTTGGINRVLGPEKSFIHDNNHLALALTIILPLSVYLIRQSSDIRARYTALGVGALSALSVVASFSRGAMVALGIGTLFFLVRTRNKAAAVVLVVVGVAGIWSFMPTNWFDRMSTIEEYSVDKSFQGRLDAWKTSVEIAKANPLTGGGFTSIELDKVYFYYNPNSQLTSAKAAHSIYFQVLGDHGYVGFLLYMLMIILAWQQAYLAYKKAAGRPELKWIEDLSFSLQISFVSFFAGGALLSMAYYDGMLILLVVAGQLHVMAKQELETK